MMATSSLFTALLSDSRGAMAIETGLVAPILAVLSVGGFEASYMVARQSELQSAVAEATSIVLAVSPETQTQLDEIEQVIEASVDLEPSAVTLSRVFRCGSAEAFVLDDGSCSDPDLVSTFIRIQIRDTYEPQWTRIGIGRTLNYNMDRTVQIS